MTTLGALSVGLLVLVLVGAAGIVLLARSQRRAPRGPEQPRTVADLVRIRETEARAAAGTTTGSDSSADGSPVAEPAQLAPPAEAEASSAAVDEPGPEVAESAQAVEAPESVDAEGADPQAPACEAPQPALGPVDSDSDSHSSVDSGVAGGVAAVQDTPWARAARMADPLGEWTASARAARDREGAPDPRQAPVGVSKAATPEKEAAVPPPPRLSLLEPDRAALPHDTTTIAHLPRGFGRLPAPSVPPEVAAPPADPLAAVAPDEIDGIDEITAPVAVPDDDTVQIGQLPGAGAAPQAPAGPAGTDDSVTVNLGRPLAGLPAEPAGRPPAAEPPEEPTAPIEPTACAAFGTAVGQSATATLPTPARVAGRVRRSPSDTAAEQAAADLALLRTFGVAGPGRTAAADDTEVELEGCSSDDAEPSAGTAQPVAFRVVDRDGRGLAGASVTLLDDHGREISGTAADEIGAGRLTARRPGGYMLVTAADGYQPGAITIAVADSPVDTEIPLTRSASIAGSVCGEDGPIVGAHLVLVQDGEIVDTAESRVDGAYVFADLAAGEYGLSITASECEPTAVVLRLADEADLRHDVDLDPVGLPAGGVADDVMIGHL